jgi:SAM-dependent methyltransferase
MNKKKFYEDHKNFACRTFLEYYLSPGIKCKFDILMENIGSERKFFNALDLGCSGNSFLYFFRNCYSKSFFDIALLPLKQYKSRGKLWHPFCGDINYLPYRNHSFDFITALDVLEHLENDERAIEEISRILQGKGIAVITVPHRNKYYTRQDEIIGHYRRYEIDQVVSLFRKYGLKLIRTFGIYGSLMKVSDLQSINPKDIESRLEELRKHYENSLIFKLIWDIIIKISSNIMKIDAKYHSFKKVMNIGFIFEKI